MLAHLYLPGNSLSGQASCRSRTPTTPVKCGQTLMSQAPLKRGGPPSHSQCANVAIFSSHPVGLRRRTQQAGLQTTSSNVVCIRRSRAKFQAQAVAVQEAAVCEGEAAAPGAVTRPLAINANAFVGNPSRVWIRGSFNNWAQTHPCVRDTVKGVDVWRVDIEMLPGVQQFKFFAEPTAESTKGQWKTSTRYQVCQTKAWAGNNYITVADPPKVLVLDENSSALKAVEPLVKLYIQANKDEWIYIHVHATKDAPAKRIEMIRTDTSVDRPGVFFHAFSSSMSTSFTLEAVNVFTGQARKLAPQGHRWTVSASGAYYIDRNAAWADVLQPFPLGQLDGRLMLVSDIDGTMVGTDENDSGFLVATEELTANWEHAYAAAGSVMVLNTGRSIGMVLGLLESAGTRMALPNAIITAMGNKIFLLDANCRAHGHEMKYTEDLSWRAKLQQAVNRRTWNVDTVRSFALGHICNYSAQGIKCEMSDDGTEHPFRISIKIAPNHTDELAELLRKQCQDAGLNVDVIVSGVGPHHRYLDVTAVEAGKENALHHLRKQLDIQPYMTVAAGDSGNDQQMLCGQHHPAIVVGNAQPDLKKWAEDKVADPARKWPLLMATQECARGILAGLAALGFVPFHRGDN